MKVHIEMVCSMYLVKHYVILMYIVTSPPHSLSFWVKGSGTDHQVFGGLEFKLPRYQI